MLHEKQISHKNNGLQSTLKVTSEIGTPSFSPGGADAPESLGIPLQTHAGLCHQHRTGSLRLLDRATQ
jgi:hypothetical protein